MTIGIYLMRFKGTNSVYIGQSVNMESRFMEHLNDMRKSTCSSKLNHAYLIYGKPTFEFLIVCSISELNTYEEEAISIFNSFHKGFNSTDVAGNATLKGVEHPRSKHDKAVYIGIFKDLVANTLLIKEIAIKHNTTKDLVQHIALGRTQVWLSEEYPKEYTKLLSLIGSRQKTYEGLAVLKSPEGELYELDCSVREFARRHELPSSSHISNLINGKRKSYLKWTLHSIEK